MCSTSCCPAALHAAFSSPPPVAFRSRVATTAHVSSSLLLRPRIQRRFRIRGFAGEGEGADKAEENGANAATDGVPASKGFGASKSGKSKTIRRSAPQQPLLQAAPKQNQVSQLETAYVVALTFLVGVILVEGLALGASGFLPEEWDDFLVKSLYPAFSPTVGLFLLAASGYGVFKYLGLGPSKE